VALGTLRRLWRDGLVTDINIDLVPGADRAAVRAAILQRSGAEYRLEVLEPKALEAQLTAGIERTFAFTWGVQAITLVVAFAGVFDTVLAGVLARRREIGVLRALGCLRRQVATAFALEGLLIGGLAAALGVAGGLALAFTQVRVLFPDLLGYVADVHVPAVRLAGIAAASLVLTAAAAALPARRAAHLVVTEALAVS
jgi:putative ABC transport system permease protein